MQFNYFDILTRAQKGYARLLEPICRKWEITRNELDVLLFLANNPEFDRAADIVNNRGMSKSHVSLSVSNLEERGLLTRRDDPSDRRTIHLQLTQQAHPIAREGQEAQKKFFAYIHRGITQEEAAVMASFTQKVSENIRTVDEIL